MKNLFIIFVVFVLVFNPNTALAYIVVAKEINSNIVDHKGIDKGKGEFEVHYEVDEENGIIYRKEVNNFRKNERIEDSTTYQIIENSTDLFINQKLIRAVGKPAMGSTEFLVIGEDFVISSRSTGNYIVVAYMERLEVKKF